LLHGFVWKFFAGELIDMRLRKISASFFLACSTLNAAMQVSSIVLPARLLAVVAIDWVGMRAAFADPAVDGQTAGSAMLGGALGAVADPGNQSYVSGLNPTAGTPQMTSATGQYTPYMDPQTNSAIPDWAAAQNAVLTNPVCNNAGWSSVMAAMTGSMVPAATNAVTTCKAASTSLLAQMNASGGAAVYGSQTYQYAQSLPQIATSLLGIAQNMVKISAAVPSCNLVQPATAMTVVNSVTTQSNSLNTYCGSIPAVTAGGAPALVAQIQSQNAAITGLTQQPTYKQAMAQWQYGASYAANTNGGQLTIGSLMGTPGTPSPTGGLSSLGSLGGSPVTAYLNDPKNAALFSGFMKFVRGTAASISDNFSNCAASQTSYATTATGSASAPASQSVTTSTPPNPNACPMPTHAASTVVMDPSAIWIYGNAAADCAQPAGNAALYTIVNNSYATAQSFTFMIDGSYLGATMDGGPITNGQTITMAPGLHTITINATGPVVAAGMNGSSVVFDTASGWGIQTAGTTAPNGAFSTMASMTANYPMPSAQQNTVLCKASIQCLGTQCHSIMATQDQTFGQAMTGLSALQQMQENAQCAPGTSVAMGNCAPILFQGNANTCRTFPGGGWLTNDCCNNPVKTPLLSTVLKIAASVYTVGAASGFGSTVMSSAKNWMGSSYQNISGWYDQASNSVISGANQAWSTVSAPFKSAAQSWSNAFGGGGPSTIGSVAGLIGTAQPTSGSSGPSSGGGASAAGALNVIGSLSGVLASGGIAPIAANLATQLMGANVAGMIFGTTVTGGSAFVAGTAPTSGTLVTAGPSVGTGTAAQGGSAATATMGILGTVLLIYAIYQIVVLIAHLITSCKDEEFSFKQYRDLKECFWVGSYCASSVLGICLETKWVGCCYPSPLIRIIAQQIVFGQPGVIPGDPGTPQSPSCAGLTPDQLAKVDWSKISLQEWMQMLVQGGMMPTTNTQGANTYTVQNSSHATGVPQAYTAAQQGAQAILPAP
jgi:conjugal transfer mating pair stabilization protein TraN